MEVQKFIPEGWNINPNNFTKQEVLNSIDNDNILQGRVIKCDNNYNLHVELSNDLSDAIIPRTEIEAICVDSFGYPKPNICYNKVNKFVQFKVKEITNEDIAILSRKEVGNQALKWIKRDLKAGDIVNGIVTNIRPFGVFVEIGGGISGLLHIEDISVARIKDPSERFKVGQKVQVMIKYINSETNRIELTYKELLGTWEENVQNISEGTIVHGIAREKEKNNRGIFIELMPNLVGLAEYIDGVEYGKQVNVLVKRIIPEKKKIKLVLVK